MSVESIFTPDEDKTCGHQAHGDLLDFDAPQCGKPAAWFWTYGNALGFVCADHGESNPDPGNRPIEELGTELVRRQRHMERLFGPAPDGEGA